MAKKRTKKKSANYTRRDIYQEITDRILKMLDEGTVPWHNPIRRGSGDGWPKNLDSQKRYRGINVFLLAMRSMERGFGSDYWLTFRQAASQGGKIRKGEKASLVTFWKLFDKKDKNTGEEMKLPVLRHYNVFNVEQCEGIKIPDAPNEEDATPFVPLEQAEAIANGYRNGPTLTHVGSQARYRPAVDTILIPPPERFDDRESYYGTLYHEQVHSTGIAKRLGRGLDQESPPPFGSPDYSKEELIAEMGAAFLNAAAGISPPTIEQSAAYIGGWQKVLKGDKRLVVTAAGAAQKAADWILGDSFFEASESASSPESPLPEPPTSAVKGRSSELELF